MKFKMIEAPVKPKNPNAKGHGDNRVPMMIINKETGKRVRIKFHFKELMEQFKPDVIPLEEIVDAETPMRFLCLKHNKEFKTKPKDLFYYNVGCNDCWREKKYPNSIINREAFLQQMEDKWPDIEIIKIENTDNNVLLLSERVFLKNKEGLEWDTKIETALKKPYKKFTKSKSEKPKNYKDPDKGIPIAISRPDLIPVLKNKSDAYKYSKGSHDKIWVVCPNCGTERKIAVKHLTNYGLACHVCKDGISYPNKFIRNLMLLLQLDNLEFEKFLRYDGRKHLFDCYFEINGQGYICEVDGGFHFRSNRFHHNITNQQEIDKLKDKIVEEQGWIMIRIACPNSKRQEMMDGIMNSILPKLFDLSNIDWNDIESRSHNSLFKEVCDYINEHPEIGTRKIAEYFNVSGQPIRSYYHKGIELGWITEEAQIMYLKRTLSAINYVPIVVYKIDGTLIGAFGCTKEFAYKSESLGVKATTQNLIKQVLEGKRESYNGLMFKFLELTKDEMLEIIEKHKNKEQIDFNKYLK